MARVELGGGGGSGHITSLVTGSLHQFNAYLHLFCARKKGSGQNKNGRPLNMLGRCTRYISKPSITKQAASVHLSPPGHRQKICMRTTAISAPLRGGGRCRPLIRQGKKNKSDSTKMKCRHIFQWKPPLPFVSFNFVLILFKSRRFFLKTFYTNGFLKKCCVCPTVKNSYVEERVAT